jgi:2-keto-4-pentenoate hydratase/2-oxohepta-3-ene-1,7-dioic acid hydratase in catechol pathway
MTMKLVSYRREGQVRHGQLQDDAVQELGAGDLETFLRAGPPPEPAAASYAIADVELLPPLTRPGKLLAVAANYQDHVTESGGAPLDRSRISPRLFLKPPTALCAPGAAVPLPSVSREVDWEAELAVVIGRTAKDLGVEQALSAVAGYTVANDVSARSVDYGYARDTDDPAVRFFDWLAGKWPDGFCPLGPHVVTADEIPDPQALDIELLVNDVVRQQSSTRHMIFSVAELVAFASRLMTLEPGDVLLTGTPSGVGATTGDFLSPGDQVAITISGVGTLTHHVERAPTSSEGTP